MSGSPPWKNRTVPRSRCWYNRKRRRCVNIPSHDTENARFPMLFDDTTLERFWAKVDKNGPLPSYNPSLGPCWFWLGAINHDGYGTFYISRRGTEKAHRLAYKFTIGQIPEGLQLDHLCRVRCCVNPSHVEVVTNRTNVLRGVGLTAQWARQTHCINGHPFDLENTYIRKTGGRLCRACKRTRDKEYARIERISKGSGY